MIIMGIDPGIARLGWGIVNKEGSKVTFLDYGCIETGKELFPGERLEMIYADLHKIFTEYKPEFAVVEKLFFSKNVSTAMSVSETRGVIILVARQYKAQVIEFTPDQIKMAVTGYGKADKKAVQKMVKMILKLDHTPQPDDAADGLAAAIAQAHTGRLGTYL